MSISSPTAAPDGIDDLDGAINATGFDASDAGDLGVQGRDLANEHVRKFGYACGLCHRGDSTPGVFKTLPFMSHSAMSMALIAPEPGVPVMP